MEENKEKKATHIDFDGVIVICKDRGVKKTIRSIAKETGFAVTGINKLRKTSPKAVTMLYHFLKENDLKFEDVVKEVD